MKKNLTLLFSLTLALALLSGCGTSGGTSGGTSSAASAGSVSGGSGSSSSGSVASQGSSAGASSGSAVSAPDGAQGADFYSVCTNYSKTEVEQFASQIKEQILSSDWAGLAENTAYPITVGGVTYTDSAAFAAAPFDTLLNKSFLDAVESENCTDLFCNSNGIMMGNGEVWIAELLDRDLHSQGLRVIAVNVPDETQAQDTSST